MRPIGIVCEYNPLHLGHQKQLDTLRALQGEESTLVCLMSGSFVQRGHPAIFDKMRRARAAVDCGADLVLELPVTAALSSAEGFAAGGVAILSKLCGTLSFGAEDPDSQTLMDTAGLLLSPDFSPALRLQLDRGLSFPAARQAAVEQLGGHSRLLAAPNNILAVEYCKAILEQKSPLEILPIARSGSYHAVLADASEPSATALRSLLEGGQNWEAYVPEPAREHFRDAPIHTLAQGEKAILARLRTMRDEEFELLPYGSEGLWRKLMHASRSHSTLEQILSATKSKRYTRTRLDRMVLCALLGLTQQELAESAPYARVLAFNDRGRSLLAAARDSGFFPNIGQDTGHPYQCIEQRCGALYGLFAREPEPPAVEKELRVYYRK